MKDKGKITGETGLQPPEDGIGERIKSARQRPGYDLSVEALSRLCRECDAQSQGITASTLLRYEQGKVLPGAREIRILCNALDVSADWLLTGDENPMGLSLSEGLALLDRVIKDRRSQENPFYKERGLDIVKAELIRKAKIPQKR